MVSGWQRKPKLGHFCIGISRCGRRGVLNLLEPLDDPRKAMTVSEPLHRALGSFLVTLVYQEVWFESQSDTVPGAVG